MNTLTFIKGDVECASIKRQFSDVRHHPFRERISFMHTDKLSLTFHFRSQGAVASLHLVDDHGRVLSARQSAWIEVHTGCI